MDQEEIEFEKAFSKPQEQQDARDAEPPPIKECRLRPGTVVYEGGCEACE